MRMVPKKKFDPLSQALRLHRHRLAASRTWVAAVPVSPAAWVTPAILVDTSAVPSAACWALRAISWVAAPCSSTAEAIVVLTSLTRRSCRRSP